EFEVIAQIKLLQSACNSYCLTPDQKFIQWFKKQQYLTEEESDRLSREVEAASDTISTSPKPQKSMVKRLSQLFLSSEVILQSTSTKKQPPPTPDGSSGESTDSASVSLCESNEWEAGNTDISPLYTPGDPLQKLSELESSDSSSYSPDSTDTSSMWVSHVILATPSFSSNDEGSAAVAPATSEVPSPVYNQQIHDRCIIRISTEANSSTLYKSILLTSQDRTPAVIQSALVKYNLDYDAVEDYELVQVISEDKELVLPDNANVFYAMNSRVNFDFILRRKALVKKQVEVKSLTFPRTAKQGCQSNRLGSITL
ncbi:PREDICTED: ral guanine nucleotide dissociation stimulator-like 1, partial [Mesitornis unicolor]|uniref:ral guanine nucleotide dissociation stimulator-like 1 n=1 Tax=Mesitornis unicolor TaxID=54374 RepID=UPI0005282E54